MEAETEVPPAKKPRGAEPSEEENPLFFNCRGKRTGCLQNANNGRSFIIQIILWQPGQRTSNYSQF